ncbi:hypothetical protein CYY_002727 [Polysphondylium violaceum]|uniref:Uncharacterized protein n=1 Tax=Polysphondylium violaceum TaxID=133409 RepID=A0A8J4Q7L4_9MYCE|nr:hypothetical protein CYY_002727 [Polysphondylium violaceum]
MSKIVIFIIACIMVSSIHALSITNVVQIDKKFVITTLPHNVIWWEAQLSLNGVFADITSYCYLGRDPMECVLPSVPECDGFRGRVSPNLFIGPTYLNFAFNCTIVA